MKKHYCTGCRVMWEGFHVLMDHRRTHRCGGRFLPAGERYWYDMAHASGYPDFKKRAEALQLKRMANPVITPVAQPRVVPFRLPLSKVERRMANDAHMFFRKQREKNVNRKRIGASKR